MSVKGGIDKIITNGLVYHIDNPNSNCYTPNATIANNLAGGDTSLLENGVSFTSSFQGGWVFDGVDDYINFNSILPTLKNQTQGTWECWVKIADTAPSGFNNVIGIAENNASVGYIHLQFKPGNSYLRILCTNGGVVKWNYETSTSPLIPEGSYKNIVMVQDGSAPTAYADGVELTLSAIITTDTTFWLNDFTTIDYGTIGCTNFGSGGNNQINFYNGDISIIKLYDRALSAAEVLQNYNALKGRFGL